LDSENFVFERYLFELENQPVKVEMLLDTPAVIINEKTIGPFDQGSSHTFPLWQAQYLVQNKYAKYRSSEIDISNLPQLIWKEQNDSTIQELPHLMYSQIKFALDEMHEQNKTSSDPISVETEEETRIAFRDLLELRLSKILKFVRLDDTRAVEKKLTEEERWIFTHLSNLIHKWKTQIISDKQE
jgi:hypothetical protein